MGRIRNELNNLKEGDIWSFILFALYKARNIPELSSLSELAYILDKSSLIKLCAIFGGSTLTIPTLDDLEVIIYSLLLYQYIDIEHMSYEDAIKQLSGENIDIKAVKAMYIKLKTILSEYEFSSRSSS